MDQEPIHIDEYCVTAEEEPIIDNEEVVVDPVEIPASHIQVVHETETDDDGIIKVVRFTKPESGIRILKPTDYEVHPVSAAAANELSAVLHSDGYINEDDEDDPGEFVMNQTKDLGQSTSYWDSFERAEAFLRDHEVQYVVKYVSDRSQLGFTARFDEEQWCHPQKGKSHFQMKNNIPCLQIGARVYGCKFGPDKNIHRRTDRTHRQDGLAVTSRKRKNTASVKVGCVAKAVMLRYAVYPEYRVKLPLSMCNKHHRKQAVTQLKQDMELGRPIKVREMYELIISDVSEHLSFHQIGQAAILLQGIDKRLRQRIHQLVELGITSSPDMKKHLRLFVDDLVTNTGMEQPDPLDPRFYPKDKTIINHIHLAKTNISNKTQSGIEHSLTLQQAATIQQTTTTEDPILGQLIEITTTYDGSYIREVRTQASKNKRMAMKLAQMCDKIVDRDAQANLNQSLQELTKFAQQFARDEPRTVISKPKAITYTTPSGKDEVTVVL